MVQMVASLGSLGVVLLLSSEQGFLESHEDLGPPAALRTLAALTTLGQATSGACSFLFALRQRNLLIFRRVLRTRSDA